jgi:hypothetical protein
VTVSENPQAGPRLSERELRDLRCLAGLMIPASEEFGVPGADDAAIFAVIVNSLGRDTDEARAVLGSIAGVAELSPARRDEVVAALRASGGEALVILHRVVLLCYYRDDRVMTALDMEPRPPFPEGHVLEQGDWALLEPVRKRPKIWRDAT